MKRAAKIWLPLALIGLVALSFQNCDSNQPLKNTDNSSQNNDKKSDIKFTLNLYNQSAYAGQEVTFKVATANPNGLSYTWYRNNNRLSNAPNAPEMRISSVVGTDDGSYYVAVSDGDTSVKSAVVRLNVLNDNGGSAAPYITVHPVPKTVTETHTLYLSVSASGRPAPTYQWKKDNQDLAGKTSSTLQINNTTMNHAGNYKVVVTNSSGTVTSNSVAVTIDPLPRRAIYIVKKIVNSNNHDHMLARSATAGSNSGYTATRPSKPIRFYVFATQLPGTVPIRRCWNPQAHDHSAKIGGTSCPFGWTTEGVLGYISNGQQGVGKADDKLWQCNSDSKKDSHFTVNKNECTNNSNYGPPTHVGWVRAN